MRAQDFVTATVQYHDTLAPRAWHNETLRTEVRDRLIEIAQIFVDYLEIPDFENFRMKGKKEKMPSVEF